MAQVQVYNQEGKKTSKLELADSVFAIEPNESAMHLAVVSYLANQRQGTQSTLTRSEVSGGGAKPWRQERHRSCPSGFYQKPAVDPRRYCSWPEAQNIRHQHQQEGAQTGYEVRAVQQGCC